MMPKIGTRLAIAILSVVITATGCTSEPEQAAFPNFQEVARTDAVTVSFEAGNAPDGDVSVEVREPEAFGLEDQVAATTPEGFVPVATLIVEAGPFDGLAEVRFTPEAPLPESALPVVLWETDDGGVEVVPSLIDEQTGDIIAYTEHFSGGLAGFVDFDPMGWLSRTLRGRADVEKPTCSGETDGRVAVDIGPTGDTIFWCGGADDAGSYIRLANNRNTYTTIETPAGWELTSTTEQFSATADALSRGFGDFFATTDAGSAINDDADWHIISPGDTVEIRVPAGENGWLKTDFSFASWAMASAVFAIDAFISIMLSVAERDEGVEIPIGALYGCVVRQVAEFDGNFSVEGAINVAYDIGRKCIDEIADDILKMFVTGFFTLVISKVLAAGLLIISGLPLALSVFRAAADTVASIFGDSSPRRLVRVGVIEPDDGGASHSEDGAIETEDEPAGPAGVLRSTGVGGADFDDDADAAAAELVDLFGQPDRDSGWQRLIYWDLGSGDAFYSDIAEEFDQVDALNVSAFPDVWFMCWLDSPVETCAVFLGDENGDRWFSAWTQDTTGGANPDAPLTLEGYQAGGPTDGLAASGATQFQGGEGGMLLYSSGGYFGRADGSFPPGGSPNVGDEVMCIEAGERPTGGFSYYCGVAFPQQTASDASSSTPEPEPEQTSIGPCRSDETPVFVADYTEFGVSICFDGAGLRYRGVKFETGDSIELPACADPHGGQWIATNTGGTQYVVNDIYLRVYNPDGSIIVDDDIVQYDYFGDQPNTGC